MRPSSWWQGTNKGEKGAEDLDTIRLPRSPSLGKAQGTIQPGSRATELGDFSVSSQGGSTSQAAFWRGPWNVWTQAPPQPQRASLQQRHFSRRWRADTGLLNQGPVCLGVTCETPPPTHRQMTYTYRVGKKDLFLEAADSVASRSRDGSHPSAVSLAGLPLVGPKMQRVITKQPSSSPT